MRSIFSVCLILLLPLALVHSQTAAPSLGSTLRTLDGKTYTEVKLMEIEADGIRIAHSSGVAKLQLDQLQEDARKYFAEEIAKKAAMQTKIDASRRGEQERIATEKEMSVPLAGNPVFWKSESLQLKVLEVRPDGVVAKREVADAARAALPVFVEGVVGKAKDQMWMARVIRAGTWRHESRTLPKYRLTK